MPTPAEIIDMAASLMNDTVQSLYTDAACLPYLNMALDELQERMEEANIPVTDEVSSHIIVPAGMTHLQFGGNPPLPVGLIEIQQIWESNDGGATYSPMTKQDDISPNFQLSTANLSLFGIWAWHGNRLELPYAAGEIYLKLKFIRSIFPTPIPIEQINADLGVRFKNIKMFLGYKTAALCSMFIGANETRALALDGEAEEAIERALNIPTKGRQTIITRRRPFRSAYKSRGYA